MPYQLTIEPVNTDHGAKPGETGYAIYIDENIETNTVIGRLTGFDPGETKTTYTVQFARDIGGRYKVEYIAEYGGYCLVVKSGGSTNFDYEDEEFYGIHNEITFSIFDGTEELHQGVIDVKLNDVDESAPVNAAPTVTVTDSTSTATDTGANIKPFTGIDLNDNENDDLTVTIAFDTTGGDLDNVPAGVTSSTSGAIKTYTFTGKASDLETIFDNLEFNPAQQAASTGTVTTNFAIAVKDTTHGTPGTAQQGTVTVTTTITDKTPPNAAPTVTVTDSTSTATDTGANIKPFTGIDLNDNENDTLTVTIAFDTTGGDLDNVPAGVTSSTSGAIKTYTFTGKADVLEVIFDNLEFNPTPQAASTGTVVTPFTFKVMDPTHGTPGTPQTGTVTVTTTITDKTPPNAAPTVTVTDSTSTATDTGANIKPFTGIDLNDNENDTLTVTIAFDTTGGDLANVPAGATSSTSGAIKTYTFTGKADVLEVIFDNLEFNPTPQAASTGTVTTNFAIAVKDPTHTAPGAAQQGTVTVNTTITDKTVPNEAPTVTVTGGTSAATDTGVNIKPFTGIDLNDNENDTLTVTIAFDTTGGDLANVPAGVTSSTASGSSVKTYTFTGKAGDLETIFDNLEFNPAQQTGNSGTVTTNFAIAVKDPTHNDPGAAQQGTVTVNTTITNKVPPVVNSAPSDITLSASTIAELSATGAVVGNLGAVDAQGGAFKFELLDNAMGRFSLDAAIGQIKVANGVKLDFEQAQLHKVTVKVTDAGGLSFQKSLEIKVSDVNPEVTLGSQDNDVIKGGTAADKLGGGLGNDILWGGAGKDTLTGDAGNDTFVFSTKIAKNNVDKIKDYNVKQDSIWIDNALFTGKAAKSLFNATKKGTETAPKKLAGKFFTTVSEKGLKEGTTADHKIVYNKADGKLWYDADGFGGKAAVQIASFDPMKVGKNKVMPVLKASEFFIV